MELEEIYEGPDDKSGHHVKSPMGKIGKPADAVDEREADRHQSQGETIDNPVDEDIHGESVINGQ
jgi:hypothetical protein